MPGCTALQACGSGLHSHSGGLPSCMFTFAEMRLDSRSRHGTEQLFGMRLCTRLNAGPDTQDTLLNMCHPISSGQRCACGPEGLTGSELAMSIPGHTPASGASSTKMAPRLVIDLLCTMQETSSRKASPDLGIVEGCQPGPCCQGEYGCCCTQPGPDPRVAVCPPGLEVFIPENHSMPH